MPALAEGGRSARALRLKWNRAGSYRMLQVLPGFAKGQLENGGNCAKRCSRRIQGALLCGRYPYKLPANMIDKLFFK